jgi:hypothetical protein
VIIRYSLFSILIDTSCTNAGQPEHGPSVRDSCFQSELMTSFNTEQLTAPAPALQDEVDPSRLLDELFSGLAGADGLFERESSTAVAAPADSRASCASAGPYVEQTAGNSMAVSFQQVRAMYRYSY